MCLPFPRGTQEFNVWFPKTVSGSVSVCTSTELVGWVPLIHVVYINAIHDVYPNSAGSSSPDGIHICVLLKFTQNPHSKDESISGNVDKTHAAALVIKKATFNQRKNTATGHSG